MNLFTELHLLSLFFGLLPIVFAIMFKLFNLKEYKYIFIFLITNFFFSCISYVPYKLLFGLEDNLFLYFFESSANILIAYKISHRSNPFYNKIAITLTAVIPITIIFRGYNYSSYIISTCLESAFIIFLSFQYLIRLHKTFDGESLRREPMVWFSLSLLFGYIIKFIFYSFSNELLIYSVELFRLIGNFFLPLTEIVAAILITIGFYFARKNISNQ